MSSGRCGFQFKGFRYHISREQPSIQEKPVQVNDDRNWSLVRVKATGLKKVNLIERL